MSDPRFEQDLVRALLREQHPDLADLPLRDVAGGWGNQMWRLGEDLGVRLPRTEDAPDLLRLEQKWLGLLAGRLPLPTPVPVRVGEPSALFGHPWTITRWVAGTPADHAPITDAGAADVLAGFLAALHQEAPLEAPVTLRSAPCAQPADVIEYWLEPLAEDGADPDGTLAAATGELWERAVAAPAWKGPAVWLHGDLHPANVVVRDGTLAGVVDFGDMCAGDPATDLSAAWILLPGGAQQRFFDAYGPVDEATAVRARGWAALRALTLVGIGRNGRLGLAGGKPTWEKAGYTALRRALSVTE